MTIRTSTLEGIPESVLLDCFLDAFSDYEVDITMDEERFHRHLVRNGYDPTISLGAFDGGRLVGFALFGRRMHAGRDTAYDLGTGVRPEARRCGIASLLFDMAEETARSASVEVMLLEVIRTNVKALELYRAKGFTISRSFSCYAMEDDLPHHEMPDGITCTCSQARLELYDRFTDTLHSWQNSRQSIASSKDDFLSFTACGPDGIVVAHGILCPSTGEVPTLAVKAESRGRGTASALMCAMAKRSESGRLRVLNVEDGSSMQFFLDSIGFKVFVRQYEMARLL